MDKKSRYLLYLLIILLVGSAIYKFYKFVIERDFIITAEISCDPEVENCFIWDCDIADEECDQSPYKYITKNAKNAPLCDPYTDEGCEELFCSPGEADCEITICSEDELGDEEICSADFDFSGEELDSEDMSGEDENLEMESEASSEGESENNVSGFDINQTQEE